MVISGPVGLTAMGHDIDAVCVTLVHLAIFLLTTKRLKHFFSICFLCVSWFELPDFAGTNDERGQFS